MSAVENWSVLSKSSIDNTHYVPVTGKRKFQLVQLLPSFTTVGTGGQTIYDGITFGNQLNMKGLKSATPTMLALATNAGNVEFTVLPAGIDLNACDNTTSLFLKAVDLAANVGATILPFANGGTGLSSIAKGQILYASAADTLSATSALSTNGQLLIGNATSGIPTVANLTAGANVTITNGAGTITIAANLSALSAVLDTDIYNINLNAAAGPSWISGDGASEGITVDSVGRVFIGDATPTVPALTAQLTLGGNSTTALQLGNANNYKNTYSIVNASPTTGVPGANLLLQAGVGGTGDQFGGTIWLRAGAGTGTGQSGDVHVDAGTGLLSTIAGAVRLRTYIGGTAQDALVADNEQNVSIPNGYVKYTQTPQTLTGAGAVGLTTQLTYVYTTGANALTLADGVQGQTKQIVMRQDLGNGTLTPTNLAGASTITFNDVGDTVSLMFLDGEWHIMGYYGVAIA
jgi:hypothetical protein